MTQQTDTRRRGRWRALPRWVRLPVRVGLLGFAVATVMAGIPFGWTRVVAGGHLYPEVAAPSADVAIVLGAQVEGTQPMPFLKGRLDTAAALVLSGRAKVLLVSGDGTGGSGNETAVMTAYLVNQLGIDASRVVPDPYGLDTYDSCARARQVYGVSHALVVTQDYHLARAVALCRHLGVDADGVGARCDGCGINLVRNGLRDYYACTKAGLDVVLGREPAVASAPTTAVADAVARVR